MFIGNDSTTAGTPASLYFRVTGNGGTTAAGAISLVHTGDGSGALAFQTRDAGTNAERMRLNSSGNLGLGTSTPNINGWNKALTINSGAGGYSATEFSANNALQGYIFSLGGTQFNISSYANIPLVFGTNDTERMRIDSSGALLIGATSAAGYSEKLRVFNSASSSYIAVLQNSTSSSPNGFRIEYTGTVPNSSSLPFAVFGDTSVNRFIVWSNGNVINTNNSYGAISDIKLKENIVDATPKLEKLNQVRIVNYNLIGEEQKQIGVVAQELEQIFPGMVEESPDTDKDGNDLGTTTKSVKYSVFVPMLIKAIQEQQALIQQLQADVAALKGV